MVIGEKSIQMNDPVQKLIKILKLTTSENDAEALSAMRLANDILKRNNITWDIVITSSIREKPQDPLEDAIERQRQAVKRKMEEAREQLKQQQATMQAQEQLLRKQAYERVNKNLEKPTKKKKWYWPF